MTVLDTSAVIDYLLGSGVATRVEALFAEGVPLAAPQLLVFEAVAVLRREVGRGGLSESSALAAIDDLGELRIELFPMLSLRRRAFALRHNLTIGDALFVALAEALREPLATKDRHLARAAAGHSDAEVLLLS